MWSYNLQQSQVSTERHSLAVATINTAHSLPLNNVSQSLSTSFYPSYVSNAWFILVVVLSLSCYKHLGDRRQILRIGHGQIFSPLGAVPRCPQIRNFGPKCWPSACEYLENGYMSIRGQRAGLTSWHLVQPYLCSDPGQVAYLLGSGLLSLSSLIGG